MLGVIILIVYTMLMLGITLLLTRKETTAEGFLVANRNTGAVISAMSISTTWIWSPALFTSAERAYLNGWIGRIYYALLYSFLLLKPLENRCQTVSLYLDICFMYTNPKKSRTYIYSSL